MLIPKNPSSRNEKFRELANGEDCTVMIPGICRHDSETTVLAHMNSLAGGKGMGYKADDHTGVFACYHCHTWLDQGKNDAEKKEAYFSQAQVRMIHRLGDIASSTTMRPWKTGAAKWALDLIAQDLVKADA